MLLFSSEKWHIFSLSFGRTNNNKRTAYNVMHISNSMQFNDEKLIHVNVVQFVIFVDVLYFFSVCMESYMHTDSRFHSFGISSFSVKKVWTLFQDAKSCCWQLFFFLRGKNFQIAQNELKEKRESLNFHVSYMLRWVLRAD